jgi:Cu-Zn family superoxide dismutase
MIRVIAISSLFVCVSGCMTPAATRETQIAMAPIALADGSAAGLATVTSSHQAVRLRLTVSHIPPGIHGVHIHSIGSCRSAGFTSAGSHLNPEGHLHGRNNPSGSHMGDLPNVTVNAAGSGDLTITMAGTPASVLEALFDADGASIVIHASQDDERTDPSGNSGVRIACGTFSRE